VEIAGDLMLVHRGFCEKSYDVYQVDLDNITLCRVKNFGGGGHALFVEMSYSLSVPIGVFSSGSITYLSDHLKGMKKMINCIIY
jgi:hypothetical protein